MSTKAIYEDDKFDKLESDVDKMRGRFRQYISYGGTKGAESCVDEAIANALDECRTPRSPGNSIHIEFDERTGFITVVDNGRGIPTNLLEEIFTSLNMGSNINTTNKSKLKAETLGQNGVGSLALCALAEKIIITSHRGGTENKTKQLVFIEGKKVEEHDSKCSTDKHGLTIIYKPSKIMGKDTKIIWPDIERKLQNLQYLNQKKIKIDSIYYDLKGKDIHIKYKAAPFEDILSRNNSEKVISPKYHITIDSDDVIEELDGENIKRFVSMDVAFLYTTDLNPYIDSFSNSNNTVDNGDHLDAAFEAICRVLQTATKNSMSDKEKEKLDIKWDDVKTGLSLAVSLRTNYERLYTGQTKHKIVSPELKRVLIPLLMEQLQLFLSKNQSAAKDLIQIVKTNARVRREGEKVRSAVVKNILTNWSQYTMRNFNPCTAKGKEYKELFIVEGDSAKGSLNNSRDAHFQALFAIRGVSLNAYRVTLDQIVGPKGNKEFNDLITIMGCNVGSKFDITKLNYDKIIIASDADKISMSAINILN